MRPASEAGEARGIALIGYRATGKSTVGRRLAGRLARPFADSDIEVEAVAGRSIRAIFEGEGEPAFRDRESRALADLIGRIPGGVLATGGGAILRESNRAILREFGFVAWLTAGPETLAARLSGHRRGLEDRPALTPAGTLAEIAGVLEARTPLYREAADAAIATDGLDADRVADLVLEAWTRHLVRAGSGALR